MNESDWFAMIDGICMEKGKFFPVKGFPQALERYVSTTVLKVEMLKEVKAWK